MEQEVIGYDAAVYPLHVRTERPFNWEMNDFRDQNGGDTWRRATEVMPGLRRERDFPVTQRQEFADALRAAGFDALDITSNGEVFERAIFDPRNIRSVNAAFDPARSDSANLLAANPETSSLPYLFTGGEDGNAMLANADPAYDAQWLLDYMRPPLPAAPWIEPQDLELQNNQDPPLWRYKFPEPPKERLLPPRDIW